MRSFVLAVIAVGVVATAPASKANIVTGSFTATIDPGLGMDTLGVFAAPGTDLSGAYVNVSWSYDPSLFPAPTPFLPGSAGASGVNMGSISETINGVTFTANSDAYFCYFAGGLPSYVNDIFELCAGNVSSISPAPSFESDYSRLEFESYGQFLSGVGPVQNVPLTYPANESGL